VNKLGCKSISIILNLQLFTSSFPAKDKSFAYHRNFSEGITVMNVQIGFCKTIHRAIMRVTAIILCTIVVGNNLMANDDQVAKQTEISLDTAVNKVRRVYAGGKVINTKVENTENGKIFVIKMISADSRVLHILVDARSGEIYK
jgi:hypothetical protein